MSSRMAIITSKYDDVHNIKELTTATIITINDTKEYQTMPYNWDSISTLFHTFDKIILADTLCSNDQMIQGQPWKLTEMMIIILQHASKIYHKPLYRLEKQRIVPIPFDVPTSELCSQFWKAYPPHKNDMNKKSVTSIQKVDIAVEKNTEEWVNEYFQWIQKFTKGIIKVHTVSSTSSFHVLGWKKPLLTLETNHHLEAYHITEIKIKGGFLNREANVHCPIGRFWFVQSKNNSYLYTALTHFKPSLPWLVYRMSQGWIHRFVMYKFAKFVRKKT
ncbi:hypothetical protein ACERII_20020 [Evansella sp. AB-rgal1]|uniref:hypothetical protein n=1 Tax=Evansella sp. AB-rgal1 TaxID=3242696 RepID=UPI00359E5DBE